MHVFTTNIDDNIKKIKKLYEHDDLLQTRVFEAKNDSVKFCLMYMNAMIDMENVTLNIVKQLMLTDYNKSLQGDKLLDFIAKKVLTVCNHSVTCDVNEIVQKLSYGFTLLLVDTCQKVIIMDTQGYDRRSTTEPDAERVTKGPKEGFTESLIINTSYIRRRIRNADLKFEMMNIGQTTQTMVCISYMSSAVNDKILKEAKKRLEDIHVDIILEAEYVREYIQDRSYTFFYTIGSTERPDVAASKLLEGKILVIIDGSPRVLTIPHLFIEQFEVNEDYYNHFWFASFNRIVRILCFLLSTSIPAMYIAFFTYHQQLIPSHLIVSILASREGVPFPSFIELGIMLLTFEILREAGNRLPLSIGQTISIVGALVLGEAAVTARIISAPIVIITALTGITSLALPKLLEATIFIRFYLLLLATIFGLYGYIFGAMSVTIHLMNLKSFGVDYMMFFINLNKLNIEDTAIRLPWWNIHNSYKNLILYRVNRLRKKRLKQK